jgi:hypothetical protein
MDTSTTEREPVMYYVISANARHNINRVTVAFGSKELFESHDLGEAAKRRDECKAALPSLRFIIVNAHDYDAMVSPCRLIADHTVHG